jgi:prepilin-type N-terminal cleavage/methylation domain-containing protein
MAIFTYPKCSSIGEPQAGFSLIEVLVSFTILLIVLASVFELRLSSIRRNAETETRNQIQDLIRIDIARVRKKALQWQCYSGSSCSGSQAAQYQPARYVNSYCSKTISSQLNHFLIDEEINEKTIANNDQNINISRKINIDGKQIEITYLGSSGEQTISKNITIFPEAISWCG